MPQQAASFAGQAVDCGEFRAVPQLIEEMAGRVPNRVAVCHSGRTLTYAELDRLASGIASAAADRGVARGTGSRPCSATAWSCRPPTWR